MINLSEAPILEFFTYLKNNPEQHTIPKRYIARIRNLVFYYFIGWHRFAENETEHKKLNDSFTMQNTKADILKDIDYKVFATMPKTGPGIVEHLKNTVTLFK